MQILIRVGLIVGVAGLVRGTEHRGEILVGEHNCVACHDAGDAAKERLNSRAAPVLGKDGVALTPQWVRAYLDNPQKVKPGSLQPDLFGGLSAAEKAEAVEALTQYVVSLNPAKGSADAGPSDMAAGRELFHKVGCVACHAPSELPPKVPGDERSRAELAALATESVPLGDLASKTTIPELSDFLMNPLKARPSGRMPSFKLSKAEAHAISAWLLRDQMPADTKKVEGLKFEYFEPAVQSVADFNKAKPKASGDAAQVNASPKKRGENFALRFRGTITVPKEGEYKFYVSADDGAWLFVDGKLVVDNGGIHPDTEKGGQLVLTAGDHSFECLYFDGGGQIALKASWEGPGIPKQEIPASAFTHGEGSMKPTGGGEFALNKEKVAKGRELFVSMNCAACHQVDQPGTKSAKALAALDLKRADGCLSESPAKGLPKFHTSADDREAMRAALAKAKELEKSLPNEAYVEKTVAQMNCIACHSRDEMAGPQGLRRDYFATAGDLDLGDEGRIPPSLTGVGAKLKQQWLTNVIFRGATVRPYMATRMPVFGEAGVKRLPEALMKTDIPKFTGKTKVPDGASATSGRKLVGVGGLSCIICHNFAGKPSLGVPAIDLTTFGDRLRYEWFHDYMINPQSLRPGTRMPSFWPEGVAANKSIEAGHTEKQIGAIWAYISKPKGQRLPEGMNTDKRELLADTEALIYRNFIEGCGPRGIGVGYPEKANLAFDSDWMSIALLWQGSFMDTARHRSGRGQGFEPPMGDNVVKWTPGSPFAVLETDDAKWPEEKWRSTDLKFKGYKLDDVQRPAFLYSFRDSVVIADYPVAVENTGANPGFKRTITLIASKPVANFYFRAALAHKIEPRENGVFIVDDKVTVKLSGAPKVRTNGSQSELLVPVEFKSGKAVITEELAW